jgi:hypothetical protein
MVLVREADEDVDLEAALVDWRRYRKRKRLARLELIDALYRAELTGFALAAAAYALAGLVGDDPLSASQLSDVARHGADWLGVMIAALVAFGLRSGARGGPLVLEPADVRHVLLAPVDRTVALRGPALRQLRTMGFVAVAAGLMAGLLVARRLTDDALPWMGAGALLAVVGLALAYGTALCASAARLPSPVATALGVALLAWAGADAAGLAEGSPATAWGHLGMWPMDFSWLLVGALVVTGAVLAVGLALVGDVSIEAAERRARLVGQLRFAATLQDIRTVVVLRRQLAMEGSRLRPWLRLRVRGTDRLPIWTRGWRGVLRWPLARLGRLVLLAVAAGLALRGAWEGTTPLVVVAGLALFVAGLDAVEALGQDVDRPTRTDTVPRERGAVHVSHLPVGVATMLVVAAVAGVALLVGSGGPGLEVTAVCVPSLALSSVAGAAISTVMDPQTDVGLALATPEVAGVRVALRMLIPPALAVAGTLPLLAARAAGGDQTVSPARAAAAVLGGVVVAAGATSLWLRAREPMRKAWDAWVEQQFGSEDEPARARGA